MPLNSCKDVIGLLAESISQARRGEPRVTNAIGYMSSIVLKALEQGIVEERLVKIEAALGLAADSGKEVKQSAGQATQTN